MIDETEEEGGGEEGAPAWMATFSDLATLLLTFFVLLLSFANMDIKNFRVAMGSVKEAMGVDVTLKGDYEARSTTPIEMSTAQAVSYISVDDIDKIVDAALKLVMRMVKKKGLESKIEVVGTSRGIVLRTKDHVLFDKGSAFVEDRGGEALELISDLMADFTGDLEIQGHTDNIPINTSQFSSNWELSSARAISVLRYLVEKHGLAQERIHVAGYADTRPVAPMDTEAGRGLNRRVEFVFEYPLAGGDDGKVFRPVPQEDRRPGSEKTPKKPAANE